MKRSSFLLMLLALPLIPVAAQGPAHEHDHDEHVSTPTDPPIRITINPEVRVSVSRGGHLPAPVECGRTLEVAVAIVNEGFLTAPLEARLVEPVPPGVRVSFSAEPLKGIREERRLLRVTLENPGLVDMTVAFRAKDDVPDLNGRDRIHLLVECQAHS